MSGIHQLLLGGSAAAPAVDPYFYSVTSLLHGDGTNGAQNNTFLDSSTNNFTITRNGNTTQGSFSPFSQTGWSNHFINSTSDYLSLADNAALEPGSSDLTWEMWINTISTVQYATLYSRTTASFSTSMWSLMINYASATAGDIALFVGDYSTSVPLLATSGVNIRDNAWHHIAVVRNGSSWVIYVDGFSYATNTWSGTILDQSQGPNIGRDQHYGRYLDGYLSNLRIVKGSAVYTANFTVPTTPLTAITNTSLLTCQANRFLDASSNAFAITRNGNVSVQPFSPFNPLTPYSTSAVGGSGYFDGSGDYLETPSNAAFTLGSSGDFTVECWVYATATPGNYAPFMTTWSDANTGYPNRWFIGVHDSKIKWYNDAGGSAIADSVNIPLNTWIHVAAVRSGSTITLYKNGVSLGTQTTSQSYTTQGGVKAGYSGIGGAYFYGYISDARVVKGSAVYTSAFTPPTAPLTAITNTSLLTNFTNAGIFDNAADADYETVGNAQISTSVKKYGTGSMAFDGTGDYLVTNAPSTQLQNLGSGDFTVEMWLYFNNVSSIQTIIDWRDASTVAAYPLLVLNSDGTLLWSHSNNTRITSGPVSTSIWYHVAVCRVAGQTKLFINGSQSGSTYADSTTYLTSTGAPRIGIDLRAAPLYYFNGYIDDLRISKGIGRYPYNFTPPTAEFPNIGGTVTLTADPYFDYTTLLLPGNGTNGAQNNTFLDSSTNNFTITRNGNPTQGTFSPFSQTGWSLYQNPLNDYLNFTTGAGTLFQFTGDYTIEGWVFLPSIGSDTSVWVTSPDSVFFHALNIDATNYNLYLNSGSVTASIAHGLTLNSWNHVAMVRSGSTITMYTNGTSRGTTTNSSTNGYASPTLARIGGGAVGSTPRYLSNFRIVKGTAVYTANFTPPSTPLTAISGTSLLTASSNRFNDVAAAGSSPTITGSPSIQAFSPFNPTAAWSAATYGGSGYFDGSGDYLTSSIGSIASGASFTFEFWAYYTGSLTANTRYFDLNSFGFAAQNLVYRVSGASTGSGAVEISMNGSQSTSATGTAKINTWQHHAISYNGTTLSIWVDGTRVISYTPTAGALLTSIAIGSSAAAAEYFTGYISGFRLVIGSTVYTPSNTTITVPTSPPTAISGTSLLTNFTNAGIYDATSKNDLETVGNAQISTTQSKFGGSSMYFDGTGDYLVAPSQAITSMEGDFTVEFWAYRVAGNNFFYTTGDDSLSSGISIYIGNSGNNLRVYSANGVVIDAALSGVSFPATTWTHIALVRYSGVVKLYASGFQAGSSWSSTTTFSGKVYVGAEFNSGSAAGTCNGYIQDFRITKGIARYTSNFTPPTTAFLTL